MSFGTDCSHSKDKSHAVEFFRALITVMANANSSNVMDMTTALQFALQLAPPTLWGEALHVSGLFAHIVRSLGDSENSNVCDTTRVEPG